MAAVCTASIISTLEEDTAADGYISSDTWHGLSEYYYGD
jgi:hypothetical protein